MVEQLITSASVRAPRVVAAVRSITWDGSHASILVLVRPWRDNGVLKIEWLGYYEHLSKATLGYQCDLKHQGNVSSKA